MRFDEIELQPVTFDVDATAPPPSPVAPVSLLKRGAALLTDLSLFAALGLALSPLLPASMTLLLLFLPSPFYYFPACGRLKKTRSAIFFPGPEETRLR